MVMVVVVSPVDQRIVLPNSAVAIDDPIPDAVES
jgi:hypothetical protein